LKILADTHLLIWAATRVERLSQTARAIMDDPENMLMFSAISIWEIAIKFAHGRPDFQIDPGRLRRALLDNDYAELDFRSEHGLAVLGLPPIHRDPFDRALIAQARSEGVLLLTTDSELPPYGDPVRLV
jgi:PIN domain nuclease of toxin-antitoxin system